MEGKKKKSGRNEGKKKIRNRMDGRLQAHVKERNKKKGKEE